MLQKVVLKHTEPSAGRPRRRFGDAGFYECLTVWLVAEEHPDPREEVFMQTSDDGLVKVGILTSLLGGPFFLYLLIKYRKRFEYM